MEAVEIPLEKIQLSFGEDLLAFIGKELCDGLRYLHGHKQRIFFNFLNKESVWLRKDGSIVLYDTHHMIEMNHREGSLSDIENIREFWSPEVSS